MSITSIEIVATTPSGERLLLGGSVQVDNPNGRATMFRVAPNLEILRDLDRVTQDQASFLCLTAFTEWFLMDPTTRGPMVVAAYRTAQREAGLPDPGTDAMEVAALLLKAIDRMPCTAHDFLGTALYRRAAKIAGWPMEDDAQDDATA